MFNFKNNSKNFKEQMKEVKKYINKLESQHPNKKFKIMSIEKTSSWENTTHICSSKNIILFGNEKMSHIVMKEKNIFDKLFDKLRNDPMNLFTLIIALSTFISLIVKVLK